MVVFLTITPNRSMLTHRCRRSERSGNRTNIGIPKIIPLPRFPCIHGRPYRGFPRYHFLLCPKVRPSIFIRCAVNSVN